MIFEVWAPSAGRVELALRSDHHPMDRDERGSWRVDAGAARPGDYYGFVLDGGEPLPDPRSPWQPLGVHGLSRVDDHDEFSWTDSNWRGVSPPGDVIYELHIGTFTPEGTFEAAIAKLPHLAELGVGAVELMPVAEFSGDRGWGYDGVDLFAPHHAYGGPHGLKRFVNACHVHGLAAVLDVVCSHLGPDGNHLGRFGPYFSDRYRTPWGEAMNLDGPGSTEVRQFLIDNALMWLERYHFDGLRLDAVHALFDQSAIHFLEELSEQVEDLKKRLGRSLFLIAESDLNDPRIVTPRTAGGYGINAQWNDDFHHALHALMTGESSGYYGDFGGIGPVAKTLTDVFMYDGRYSNFRMRRHGRSAGDLPGTRFVAYLQSHDQIGNRALSDRSSHLVSFELLKIGAALLVTSPMVPMLFMGEEWGATSPFCYFTDYQDPGLAAAIRAGRTREFTAFDWDPEAIPDPQASETFELSKLRWDELGEPMHSDLFEWHRSLVALRRSRPELTDGRRDLVRVAYDKAERWLVMERGSISVACNFSNELAVAHLAANRSRTALLTSVEPPEIAGDQVRLGPESVTIFST